MHDPSSGDMYKSFSCDLADGECKTNAELVPCIAIFDKSDYYSDSEIDAKWEEFRKQWPSRPFSLLQPLIPYPGPRPLHISEAFYADPKTTFRIVNRDNGDIDKASDWFEICELEHVAEAGMNFLFYAIDGYFDTVEYSDTLTASYEIFRENMEDVGMGSLGSFGSSKREDWISWCTEKY